jgi:gliding motility-associated-like protein
MKRRIFIAVVFLSLTLINSVFSQDRATFDICGKDGCTGLICIAPSDTSYPVKIKIVLPLATPACTTTKFEIDWGDNSKEVFTLPVNLEQSHSYNLKNFLKLCNDDSKPYRIFVTPNCPNTDKGITLTFNKKPVASIGLQRDACEGVNINLQNNSCPVNSSDISYLWDLGNGVTSTSFQPSIQNPTVAKSPYNAKLTVTSKLCGSNSTNLDIPVKQFPVAKYTTSGYTVANLDTVVCLNNGGILTLDGTVSIDESRYLWEISGGSYSFENNTNRNSSVIKIKFNESKEYTITLKAINDCGESKPLICKHRALSFPNLSITKQLDECVPINYKIPNFTQGAIYTLNGNSIVENQVVTIPLSNNPNIVTGKISNSCGVKVVADTFFVTAPQIAKITSFRDTSVCVGSNTLSLTTNISTGNWTGQFIENQQRFRPTTVGTYWLKYKNGSGQCESSDSVKVRVNGVNLSVQNVTTCLSEPYVLLKGVPNTGVWKSTNCTNCLIKKDTLFLSGVSNTSISLTYDVAENGCTAQKNATVSIGNPKANFTITGGCTGTPLTISNTSTGANNYQWFVNNVPVSTNNIPNLSNLPAGATTLLLEAIAGNCKSSFSQVISLTAPPLSLDFSTNITEGCSPLKVDFTPSGTRRSDVNYTWNFGNGVTSNLFQAPTQTFINQDPQSKIIKIVFTASNTCGSKTFEKEISIKPVPKAEIGVDSTVVRCSPARLRFSNRSKGAEKGVLWSWGDGKTETSLADTISHLYSAKDSIRTFWVKLEVTNPCKNDKDSVAIKVYPSNVIPLFEISKSIVCPNEVIKFKDASKPIPEKFLWRFGDGSSPSQERNPTYSFKDPNKTYTITLIAYTQCGYDSVQKKIQTRDFPKGDFTFNNLVCINQPVQFQNLSNPNLFTASWSFGDNSPIDSSRFSPSHVYSSFGDKRVVMTLRDFKTGCINSFTKNINIKEGPKPDFVIVGDSNQCSPATIRFNNTSKNADSFLWRFSDGRTSTNESPEMNFKAGRYSVFLLATNNGFCKDSIQKYNIVSVDSCNIYFPEAFTPNRDGVGDKYTIFGKGIKEITCLTIRNRWGEIVFQNTNFQPNNTLLGWDGTYKDQPCPKGIYTYEIEIEMKGRKPEKLPIGCIYLEGD